MYTILLGSRTQIPYRITQQKPLGAYSDRSQVVHQTLNENNDHLLRTPRRYLMPAQKLWMTKLCLWKCGQPKIQEKSNTWWWKSNMEGCTPTSASI